MTKAEERALEAYPSIATVPEMRDVKTGMLYDPNTHERSVFIRGYEAAQKDLEAANQQAHANGYDAGLKDGIAMAKKDLGWVSVKERLPETTEYVFTCVEMNGIPQCVGFHYYKDGKWWEGYEEDSVGAVEYWMPIPKLPKEK